MVVVQLRYMNLIYICHLNEDLNVLNKEKHKTGIERNKMKLVNVDGNREIN